jgi:hypothetical protein
MDLSPKLLEDWLRQLARAPSRVEVPEAMHLFGFSAFGEKC